MIIGMLVSKSATHLWYTTRQFLYECLKTLISSLCMTISVITILVHCQEALVKSIVMTSTWFYAHMGLVHAYLSHLVTRCCTFRVYMPSLKICKNIFSKVAS